MAQRAGVDKFAYVPDEIANDLSHWYEVSRDWGLIQGEALDVLAQIDDRWDSIQSDDQNEEWTPEAVASSPFWAAERERARCALDLLGESRADDELAGNV